MSNMVIDLPSSRSDDRPPTAENEPAAPHGAGAFKVIAQDIVPTIGTLLRNVGYPAVILALLFLNFPAISRMAEALPALASRINSIEAPGFKAQLISAEQVKPTFKPGAYENPPDIVAETIRKLAPDQFERLLDISESKASCLYARPTASMYRFLALDHELGALKLLHIKEAPSVAEILRDEHTPQARERRANIGDPITCYSMKLTELGWQTKTAIIKIVSQTFHARIDLR